MKKVTLQKATGSEFCRSLTAWPESRVTCEIQPVKDSSNFSMCFSLNLFCMSALTSQSQASHKNHFFYYKFFTKLSHIVLT